MPVPTDSCALELTCGVMSVTGVEHQTHGCSRRPALAPTGRCYHEGKTGPGPCQAGDTRSDPYGQVHAGRMRQAGTSMHRAAGRFALKAQEGEVLSAYNALTEITSACVACHSGYRIR